MRKVSFLMVLLLLVNLSSLVFSAEVRIYRAFYLEREPLLDGKLKNDPAWENVPVSSGFVGLGSNVLAAPRQTFFRIGYNEEALYIGIKCLEPEPEMIKAELKDMENLWAEDSIEIFIFPKDADNYYQFVVNAIGSRWNGIGLGGKDCLWDWQAETYQEGKGYWSVEIRIPFEVFLILPEKGEDWRINICRNIPAYITVADRHTSWSPLARGFHEPDNFGKIVFKDEL